MVKAYVVVRHDDGRLEDLQDMELHFLPRFKDEIVIPKGPGVPTRFLEVLAVRQILLSPSLPTVICREMAEADDEKEGP